MLMEDLLYYKQHPEERIVFEKPNGDNPTMQEPANAVPASSTIDPSSAINAAIAAKDETIASLKRELRTKDDIIQALREQLATKDQLIAEQKTRLIEYRRIIDSRDSTLTNYPFPFGVAEDAHKKNVSPKI
jgi:hypothetical protein